MKSILTLSLLVFTTASSFAQEEPTPVRQNTQPEIAPSPAKEVAVPMSSNQSTEPRPLIAPPEPPPVAEQAPKIVEDAIDYPDVEAEFPGGQEAMHAFIVENLQYPDVSLEMKEQGVVYVSFIVEKDGSLSDIVVVRGVSADLDREARRVVRLMPKWTPAELKGKPVRSRYQLPLKFKLD